MVALPKCATEKQSPSVYLKEVDLLRCTAPWVDVLAGWVLEQWKGGGALRTSAWGLLLLGRERDRAL